MEFANVLAPNGLPIVCAATKALLERVYNVSLYYRENDNDDIVIFPSWARDTKKNAFPYWNISCLCHSLLIPLHLSASKNSYLVLT